MLPRFLILVCLFTNISCSSHKENMPNSPDWSLQPPQLVSKARKTQYSFNELKVKRPDYLLTSDLLYFHSMTESVRIQTQVQCNQGEIRKTHHIKALPRNQVAISELLPPESRLSNNWICSFQFTAKHSSGSEHYFELNQFLIEDDADNQLRIVNDPSSQESIQRAYAELSNETYFINKGLGQLKLFCDEAKFETDLKKRLLRLSDFIPDRELPNQRNIKCRAFEITEHNLVISSSSFFWRVPNNTKLSINEAMPARRTYRFPRARNFKTHISWELRNTSQKPIYLAVKRSLVREKFNIITHYGKQFNAEEFYFPIQWYSETKVSEKIPGYLIYEIPKRSHAYLSLGTMQTWWCGVWEHGYYVSPEKNNLEAFVLHNSESVEEFNIIEKLDLNYFQDKWVGLSEPIRNLSNGAAPKPFGPWDQHGSLPVKPTSAVKIYCKTL